MNSNNFFDKRLRNSERLKRRKDIALLFSAGQSAKAYPLRLVFREMPATELTEVRPPAQLGFVASKRAFKRAPDRNFVKRRMREAYRLEKSQFYNWLQERGVHLQGMLLYTGRELPTQAKITSAWCKLLRRLDSQFFSV